MDAKAYTEVNYIINKMSEELRNKIPIDVRKEIENRMDKSYNFSIDEDFENVTLLKDTEEILSVLYTDYLASEEERKIILNKEKSLESSRKRKTENNAYVQVNDMFSKKTEPVNKEISNIKKEKWYNKFINYIKRLIKHTS